MATLKNGKMLSEENDVLGKGIGMIFLALSHIIIHLFYLPFLINSLRKSKIRGGSCWISHELLTKKKKTTTIRRYPPSQSDQSFGSFAIKFCMFILFQGPFFFSVKVNFWAISIFSFEVQVLVVDFFFF